MSNIDARPGRTHPLTRGVNNAQPVVTLQRALIVS
jgi:hypothetical protein